MADGTIDIGIELEDSGIAQAASAQGEKAGKALGEGLESGVSSGAKGAKSAVSGVASSAKSDMGKVGNAAKEAGSKLGSEVKDGASKAEAAISSFASKAKTALSALAGAAIIGELKSAMGELVEVANEYQEDMGKLTTSAQVNNVSTEAATGAYRDMVGILGETDQSVEAVNHLFELTQGNTEQLSSWTDTAAGIYARFGDSLPLEGLTEATNETAKVGQVTGPLADALNWASVSAGTWGQSLSGNQAAQDAFYAAIDQGMSVEDAFNAALAETSSETERAAILTQALNDVYGEAGETYLQTNAALVQYRQSMSDLTGIQSALGTGIMAIAGPLLSSLVPGLQKAATGFQETALLANELFQAGETTEAAGLMAEAIAGLANDAVVALISAAPMITEALTTLVVSLATSLPELLATIVESVVSLLPTLIQTIVDALVLLVQFQLPVLIQNIVAELPALIEGLVAGLVALIPALVTGFVQLFTAFAQAIPLIIETLVPMLPQIVTAIVTALVENIPTLLAAAVQLFMALVTAIVQVAPQLLAQFGSMLMQVISNIAAWGGSLLSGAVSAVGQFLSGVVSTITELPGRFGEFLSQVISSIQSWAGEMWSNAVQAATDFANGVIDTLTSIPGRVYSIGQDIVNSIVSGIQSIGSNIGGAISGFISSATGGLVNLAAPAGGMPVVAEEDSGIALYSADEFGGMDGSVPVAAFASPAQGIGDAIAQQVAGSFGGSRASGMGGITVQNVDKSVTTTTQNFNQPVQTPAQFARVLRMQANYGLAGAR